jgi:hypothetical protein
LEAAKQSPCLTAMTIGFANCNAAGDYAAKVAPSVMRASREKILTFKVRLFQSSQGGITKRNYLILPGRNQ